MDQGTKILNSITYRAAPLQRKSVCNSTSPTPELLQQTPRSWQQPPGGPATKGAYGCLRASFGEKHLTQPGNSQRSESDQQSRSFAQVEHDRIACTHSRKIKSARGRRVAELLGATKEKKQLHLLSLQTMPRNPAVPSLPFIPTEQYTLPIPTRSFH